MGKRMNELFDVKVFNSPLEIALRLLLIILKAGGKGISLDKLIIYDYLILNSGDVKDAPSSLHPALPNRSSQLLVKREIVKKSLQILSSKELLIVRFASNGILYCPSELSSHFVQYFESAYFLELNKRTEWIIENFKDKTTKYLDKYINSNLNNWGSEFINESYFREELDYE